jgi:hypothetical protein
MPSTLPMGKRDVADDDVEPELVSDLIDESRTPGDLGMRQKFGSTYLLLMQMQFYAYFVLEAALMIFGFGLKKKQAMYSIKSAYRMLLRNKDVGSDSASCSNSDYGGVWKKLWKLNVMPKIRIFW